MSVTIDDEGDNGDDGNGGGGDGDDDDLCVNFEEKTNILRPFKVPRSLLTLWLWYLTCDLKKCNS